MGLTNSMWSTNRKKNMEEHLYAGEPIDILVSKLQQEKHLLQKRITNISLAKAINQGRASYKRDTTTHQYYAFCALWETKDPMWFELGDLWVDEESRRQGCAGSVFRYCLSRLPKGAGVFLITRELSVVKLARGLGWQLERNDWTQSKFWTRIAEPWDRYETGLSPEGVLMFSMP
ncbi:MAG: hypothetical protein UY50_C0001G0017 [Parcubacteria group bacterium GW2011_GWA2_49_9]|nr:MAG: hypothetical protein UY50_C0001G0017 [Parcubacteria group bacterium GW2011_GWA2_49_9]